MTGNIVYQVQSVRVADGYVYDEPRGLFEVTDGEDDTDVRWAADAEARETFKANESTDPGHWTVRVRRTETVSEIRP